jgi:hypothetical protein
MVALVVPEEQLIQTGLPGRRLAAFLGLPACGSPAAKTHKDTDNFLVTDV